MGNTVPNSELEKNKLTEIVGDRVSKLSDKDKIQFIHCYKFFSNGRLLFRVSDLEYGYPVKERRYTDNEQNRKFRLCREYLLRAGCRIDNLFKLQVCERRIHFEGDTNHYRVYDELYFDCDCGNIDIECLSKQCKYNET